MNQITRERIDELLHFLPQFQQRGPELAAAWPSMDPDPVTGIIEWPHPTYPTVVYRFFHLAAQPWWFDANYDPSALGELVNDDTKIGNATLDQVRGMLTWCVRGERFCDGLWGSLLSDGRIALILQRLAVLREELPVETTGVGR